MFFETLEASTPPEKLLPALMDVHAHWVEQQEMKARQHKAIGEIASRNADLENMNQHLELAASERLQILETSLAEERNKIQRERQFIRFLNDLASMNNVEDFLLSLRREFRRFHHLQSIFLAVYLESEKKIRVHFCEQGKVRRSELREEKFEFGDERIARQTLANTFGRPFNRLELFPLNTLAGPAFLGFENANASEKDLQEWREVIGERLHALEITLERFYLERNRQQFAQRWEKTFDSFASPVAVISPEMSVLRGNRSYTQARMQEKCYEVFARRTSPCEGCPVAANPEAKAHLEGVVHIGNRYYRLRSWPVQEHNVAQISGRVTHYDDITEAREMHLRSVQNEKMSALGELAGHIAHELNNPLTGIRSLAQVLKAETQEDQLQQDLAQIEHAAGRCQKLIRHLMDFSTGGRGVSEVVSLDQIIENTLPLLKSSLRPHRQEISLTTADTKVFVDPHLVQQVVFNLINNACQAMGSTGEIAVTTRSLEGHRVEMRIADTGPGISAEIQDRLFEPFVSTKKEGEGTGLGLSTSKSIVERFGGRIYFESTPGQGTSFFVEFPVHRETMKDHAP